MELKLLTRADIPENAITVSPSQMSLWYRCQYAWKLSKIDNVGQEDYSVYGAANKGKIFHSFMQWFYDHSIGRSVGVLSERGKLLCIDDVQRTHEPSAEFWQVFAIFMAYQEWAAKKDELVPVGAEVEVFANTGLISRDGRPIYLHGFIDLIAWLHEKLLVIDHKSHTNRPWKRERLYYDHQFIFYWLLLELNNVEVSGAMVNTVNLFIPKDTKKFKPYATDTGSRFERHMLGPKDVNLQFYLDQFLLNIQQMWCGEPVYSMRLSSECQFCTFRAHIEADAKGLHEAGIAELRVRHNTDDFELIDDLQGDFNALQS